MTTDRDEALGEALRALEVPDHAPDFFDDLSAAIGAEPVPARRLAGRRRLMTVIAIAVGAAAVFVAGVLVPRRGPTSDLGSGPGQFGPTTLYTPPSLGSGVGPSGPPPASAVEVVQQAFDAVGRVQTLSGRAQLLDVASDGSMVRRDVTFALTAGGDFRVDDQSASRQQAYQATTASLTNLKQEGGGKVTAAIQTGVAPGPPDAPATPFAGIDLGGVVQALQAAHDPFVVDTTYDGRPAWRIDAIVSFNLIGAPDQIRAVIDKGTGLPVQAAWSRAGSPIRQLDVTGEIIDRPVSPQDLTVSIPPGAAISRDDGAFHVVAVNQAGGVLGRAPTTPAYVPGGFHLAETAVAASRQPTSRAGSNPPDRQILSLSYRRGLEHFTVTTRLTGPSRPAWSDPFAFQGQQLRSQPVVLAGGALAGAAGQVVADPVVVPHLWAAGNDLVVTVAGDLSGDEMVRVAESLHQ